MHRVLAALALLAAPAHAVEIEEVTSPGGIEAWLVEEPSLPFVALELRFMGGAALDRPEAEGAVNLMAATLEEGAGDLDAEGFAAAREALAARYGFDAGYDSVSVSAQFLTENRADAVALLRDALVEPRFEEAAVERVRAQVLSGIRSDATDPDAIAGETAARLAFGDHPYGAPVEGTAESVAALTPDDLRDAHARSLARDRVVVAAVGDIDAETLGQVLDTLLGDLPEEGAPPPGPAEVALDGQVEVVPLDSPQSVILFGHEGIMRDDPDYIAAYVLNEILGGSGFDGRLMEEVRVARGLTYGIYSHLGPRQLAATYQGRVATANATAGEVVEAVREEWRRMAEEGPTETEIEEAVTYLTGAYPLRFDGNARIADILVGMQITGLDPSYVEERNDLVRALTREDLARVAERVLKPEALSFVVVGRPEGLDDEAALEEAAATD
jgi:zinc protease